MSKSCSILIPTAGTIEHTSRLIDSLRPELESTHLRPKVVIIDNHKVLEPNPELVDLANSLNGAGSYLKYPIGGRSAALNFGVSHSNGDIIVTLDDDVVVERGWFKAIESFFLETDYDFMQGRILPHPKDNLASYEYPMNPVKDKGDDRGELDQLTGCNIAGKREWFEETPYAEHLGVGASGAGEDNQFYRDVKKAGARIGYEPGAVAYHPVIEARANRKAFLRSHYVCGQSSCHYRRFNIPRVLSNVAYNWAAYRFLSMASMQGPRFQKHEGALYKNLGRLAGLVELHFESGRENSISTH